MYGILFLQSIVLYLLFMKNYAQSNDKQEPIDLSTHSTTSKRREYWNLIRHYTRDEEDNKIIYHQLYSINIEPDSKETTIRIQHESPTRNTYSITEEAGQTSNVVRQVSPHELGSSKSSPSSLLAVIQFPNAIQTEDENGTLIRGSTVHIREGGINKTKPNTLEKPTQKNTKNKVQQPTELSGSLKNQRGPSRGKLSTYSELDETNEESFSTLSKFRKRISQKLAQDSAKAQTSTKSNPEPSRVPASTSIQNLNDGKSPSILSAALNNPSELPIPSTSTASHHKLGVNAGEHDKLVKHTALDNDEPGSKKIRPNFPSNFSISQDIQNILRDFNSNSNANALEKESAASPSSNSKIQEPHNAIQSTVISDLQGLQLQQVMLTVAEQLYYFKAIKIAGHNYPPQFDDSTYLTVTSSGVLSVIGNIKPKCINTRQSNQHWKFYFDEKNYLYAFFKDPVTTRPFFLSSNSQHLVQDRRLRINDLDPFNLYEFYKYGNNLLLSISRQLNLNFCRTKNDIYNFNIKMHNKDCLKFRVTIVLADRDV